ncbi:MAG: sulfatase-like hydrolase/transferase [Pseudomonadales bacterium]
MAGRGNVLFIVCDQLRADVLSGGLAACVPTPNLDRLMAQSTVYEQHFANAVPCGPSRASLLTGLYAFNHRVIRNGTPLGAHHASLGPLLRAQGIEPLLFGYTDIAPDPGTRPAADPDLGSYEGVAPGFRELVEMRFEHGLEWLAHLRARGYPLPAPERRWDVYRPVGDAITSPALYRAEDSDTAYLTDRTLQALEVRRHAPWFAHVAYIRPHPPLVAPAPWNALVDPATIPPPCVVERRHPFHDAWSSRRHAAGLFWGFDGRSEGLSPRQVAELRAVYLGLVAELDHHIGRLLDWLDATGQSDRTLVVLTADHGEMLGDQGMWDKESVFAAAHRVPLVVRDPQHSGGRVRRITESVDIAPTLLRWLDAPVPRAMDGRALQFEPDARSPECALTEIDLARPDRPSRFQAAWGLEAARCNAAVLRDPHWTLVHFNGGVPPMLFDRRADPQETRNLAAEPGADVEIMRLMGMLLDLRMTRADRRLTGD